MLQAAFAVPEHDLTPLAAAIAALPVDLDRRALAARVLEPDLQRRPAEPLGPGRGPLDEGDAVGAEVVVEQGRVLALEALQPVEVEVGDGQAAAAVALADREGRRGDRLRRSPSARQAPRISVVLPAPTSPQTTTTSPGPQALGDAGAERFGLGRRACSRRRSIVSRRSRAGRRAAAAARRPALGLLGLGDLLGARSAAPAAGPRAGPGSSRSRRAASPSPPACAAPRPGGSSGSRKTVRPPSSCTCGVPRTLVIPTGLPVSSLVAKLPSVQTTLGSISRTCSNR